MANNAPAHPQLRKAFMTRLSESSIITKDSWVQGDFNTVPNVTLDVQYPEGSTTTYANLHFNAFETLAAKKNLTDIYRLFHGEKRGGYTRLGKTVYTRLDRLYAARYDSPWRWTGIRADANLFTSKWRSDHLTLFATVETAKARPPSAHEARIDPALYSDPSLREKRR